MQMSTEVGADSPIFEHVTRRQIDSTNAKLVEQQNQSISATITLLACEHCRRCNFEF